MLRSPAIYATNFLPTHHFPFPSFAGQQRIDAKIDKLMALCDQLETKLTTTEADSRRLLEAVLRDALGGR